MPKAFFEFPIVSKAFHLVSWYSKQCIRFQKLPWASVINVPKLCSVHQKDKGQKEIELRTSLRGFSRGIIIDVCNRCKIKYFPRDLSDSWQSQPASGRKTKRKYLSPWPSDLFHYLVAVCKHLQTKKQAMSS